MLYFSDYLLLHARFSSLQLTQIWSIIIQNKEWSDYASFAHDSVWTYALALDQLLKIDSTALDTIHSNTTSE